MGGIPLTPWADRELAAIGALADPAAVVGLTGVMLLGERAALNGLRVPGRVSAGGGCRLWDTATVPVALNLTRPDDRALLPALFGDAGVDAEASLAAAFRRSEAMALVQRGREMGLAIAASDEAPLARASAGPALPPARSEQRGVLFARHWIGGGHVARRLLDRTAPPPTPPASGRGAEDPPLVLDLSALWAGPLAANLLQLAGAHVIKVENPRRPDAMRDGDPALFARLNAGKASVALDPADHADREALLHLIARADVVIEAARPRALGQFGIHADRLVADRPDLVWMTITGHGIAGDAANWVGFGDDCGVAGGLSAALLRASGRIGFVGDAIADPLTGVHATRRILEQRATHRGARIVVSMSGVVSAALAAERAQDAERVDADLRAWADVAGEPFPAVAQRAGGTVAAFGADTARWLARC